MTNNIEKLQNTIDTINDTLLVEYNRLYENLTRKRHDIRKVIESVARELEPTDQVIEISELRGMINEIAYEVGLEIDYAWKPSATLELWEPSTC